ncbi:hypothetical protein D3C84_988800 [compost metagenome]
MFLRQGFQLFVGLGVVGDHLVGEFLDVRRLAFFQGQFAGLDFCNATGRRVVDKVVGSRGPCHAHAGTQGNCQAELTQGESVHR